MDDDLAREGVRTLLAKEPGVRLVGEATSGPAAAAVVRTARPDVLVLDLRIGRGQGVDVLRELVRALPRSGLPRVVATEVGDDRQLAEVIRLGAYGCLHSGCAAADLVRAVRTAAAGRAFLTPDLTTCLFRRFFLLPRATEDDPPQELRALSGREVEVLRLLGIGCSNQQIATRLQVRETTVKTHVSRLLAKLGLSARLQAARLAWRTGLVPPDADV